MKRIITSLALLVMVASLTIAGTRAWFSSQAQVNDITFSTGVLEVRVNGASAIAGVSMTNAEPGSRKSGSFTINNYGNPYFAGPSTLDAKEIAIKVADLTGDQELNNALMVDLFANAGWSGCSNSGVEFIPGKGCRIYTGLVKDMTENIPNGEVMLHYHLVVLSLSIMMCIYQIPVATRTNCKVSQVILILS